VPLERRAPTQRNCARAMDLGAHVPPVPRAAGAPKYGQPFLLELTKTFDLVTDYKSGSAVKAEAPSSRTLPAEPVGPTDSMMVAKAAMAAADQQQLTRQQTTDLDFGSMSLVAAAEAEVVVAMPVVFGALR
jgi:hypothetical protein